MAENKDKPTSDSPPPPPPNMDKTAGGTPLEIKTAYTSQSDGE